MRLNIACGPNVFPFHGWINYDREDFAEYFSYLRNPQARLEGMPDHQRRLAEYVRSTLGPVVIVQDARHFFHDLHKDDTIDGIYLGQMIEHLNPLVEVPRLLKECYRMLKPGGVLRITTPDLLVLLKAFNESQMHTFRGEQPAVYAEMDRYSQLAAIMFGSLGENSTYTSYEGHQFCWAPPAMKDALHAAGFTRTMFYTAPGQSLDPVMASQVVDAGLSHSMIAEAIK